MCYYKFRQKIFSDKKRVKDTADAEVPKTG